jgi:predicted negative regulator of RcsB-dependent stress response
MAVYDLEEQEKLDELKAWWKHWGNAIIAAVSVFVIVFSGIQWWRSHQRATAGEASVLYSSVTKLATEGDPKKVAAATKTLTDKYAASAYASRAALVAAKTAFDKGDLPGARTQLEWVVANAKEEEVKAIARLRLAAVLGDEKNFDGALRLLDANTNPGFEAATAAMRGDILFAQGKLADAKNAYSMAIAKTEPQGDKQLLQLKLDSLGVSK